MQTTVDLVWASGKPSFVIFTAGPKRALTFTERRPKSGYGLSVARVALSKRAAYRHATGQGKAAQEIEPEGRAALDVAELWKWVSQQVSMPAC